MAPLRTAGLHHITMVSSNAARTLAFYRDVLGVGLVKRTVNFDDPGAYHLYFGDSTGSPGTLLTFFEWPHAGRGRWGIGGVHHLALGTESEASQLKWKRRLNDHGVPVTGPYDRGYFTSIYFSDPDGQILEIATRGPGYAIDEPPDALGRELMDPPSAIVVGGREAAAIAALTHPDPVPVITPDMALEGMHHISAITNDLERAGEFYEAALGLSLIKKTINRDAPDIPHYFWASYEQGMVAPHSALTLFGLPARGHVARGGVGQTHHIAFRAGSAEEQLEWREHLLSLGVEVTPVLDRTYFTSIYFRAPDGLLLEIATDGPGFLIDEPAATLGSELRLPAWLEPRRDEIAATLSPLG
jgi:glyoxalase family protein